MAKLVAFALADDSSKVFINPAHVTALMLTSTGQTTIITSNAQGRHKFTVGGAQDEIAAKLNAASD